MAERNRQKPFNPYDLNNVAEMDEFEDKWYEDLVLGLGKEPNDPNTLKKIEHRGILKVIDRKNIELNSS